MGIIRCIAVTTLVANEVAHKLGFQINMQIINREVVGLVVRVGQVAVIALSLVLFARPVQAVSEVGANYGVVKEVKSNQIGVGTFTSATNPNRITVFTQATSNGSVAGGAFSLPAGRSATSPKTLTAANDGTGFFIFQDKLPDQATLDSNYANGTYGLQITGASSTIYSANLSLTGGVYPSVTPTVTNTNWISGNLVVDPSASFTLNWSVFTGNTASDKIVLTLTNTVTNQSAFFQFLAGSATSQTFGAGFFQPNVLYQANLMFVKVASTDTTSIAGSTGIAGYTNSNGFNIQTVPEPSGAVMLGIGAVLLLA